MPSLMAAEEFNDNIFFSAAGARSSFITTLAPHLAIEERTERLTARLDLGCHGLLYTANRDLNNVEQRYQGQAGYRLTPRIGLQAAADFERSSRPDRLVESTGLVITQESDRQNYSVGTDLTLTEKATGQFAYAYERLDYSSASVSGVEGHNLGAGLNYDLSGTLPLLKLRTNAGFSVNRYASSTVESYSATVGLSYPLRELWGVQGDLGGRLTRSTFDEPVFVPPGTVASVERTNTDPGWVASLLVTYRGELDSGWLSVTRNVQNAAGRSGPTELTAVTGEVSRRFSHELSGSLAAGYYQNSSGRDQFGTQAIDETTYRVTPTVRYTFNPNLVLDGSYEFAIIRNNLTATEAQRNKFFVRLTVQAPLFE